MDTQRTMDDLPELQRRLLELSRFLGIEPYANAPMWLRNRPLSEQDSGGGDDARRSLRPGSARIETASQNLHLRKFQP
ncbi:hypothetical protein MRX96_011061 [Rhipicephalus microplus]